jgi:hypothetical protein
MKRSRQLDGENGELKKIMADLSLDKVQRRANSIGNPGSCSSPVRVTGLPAVLEGTTALSLE